MTKLLVQANRNGFLYVLDAKDGKLITANPYGKVNWASGIDMKTGHPVVTDVYTGALEGKTVTVWPSVSGVTNWQHMSFSPRTGMLYINTLHVGMTYQAGDPPKLAPGRPAGARFEFWATERPCSRSGAQPHAAPPSVRRQSVHGR